MIKWSLSDQPLILASASPTRARMLDAAKLMFRIVPANIDEEAIKCIHLENINRMEINEFVKQVFKNIPIHSRRIEDNQVVIQLQQENHDRTLISKLENNQCKYAPSSNVKI